MYSFILLKQKMKEKKRKCSYKQNVHKYLIYRIKDRNSIAKHERILFHPNNQQP
jgi:hypothetical protein